MAIVLKIVRNFKDVIYDAREAEITGLPLSMNKLTIGPTFLISYLKTFYAKIL